MLNDIHFFNEFDEAKSSAFLKRRISIVFWFVMIRFRNIEDFVFENSLK